MQSAAEPARQLDDDDTHDKASTDSPPAAGLFGQGYIAPHPGMTKPFPDVGAMSPATAAAKMEPVAYNEADGCHLKVG